MERLQEILESRLGSRVTTIGLLPVGFGLRGATVDLADGRRLAVKAARVGGAGNLALEGYMLRELGRLSDLPVPAVHVAEPDLLVMDWIETDGSGIDPIAERHAAELLAALHAVPRGQFGYARDTLIGPLHQPNPAAESWAPFFRDHRLLYMAGQAHEAGRLPTAMLTRIEQFAGTLSEHLTEPGHPALIHGDLWTGNVLTCAGRIAGLVDPAIYHAHPEIELAFGALFGTFGRAFFDVYEALSPLEPGFHETRRDIYNLYPLLVHVRLFGSGYLAPIDRTLSRFGA